MILTIVRCGVQIFVEYFQGVARYSANDAIGKRVAAALEAERVRQGLSMNKLAESAGLSQQMVSYVERGMRNPTLATLLRICGVLKLNLGEVIKKAICDEGALSD